MPATDDRRAGVALTMASAAAFGAMAIFARAAYESGADPLGVLPPRFAVAAALLGAAVVARGVPRLERRQVVGLLLMGAVGYTLQAMAFFSALDHASAAMVALLLYLYPAIVTVLAAVLLRRPLTRRRAIAVGVALLGTALAVGPVGDGSTALGIALAVSAAVVYSGYILVNERLSTGVDPIAAAALVCAGATVSCTVVALVVRPDLPGTGRGWLAVGAIAVVSTVVAITTFFAGLVRLGASDAAALSTFEPAVTVALAAIVLRDPVTVWQLAGGAVILGAVVVLSRDVPTFTGTEGGPPAS